jgi:HlyD family secretion protein
MKNVYALASLVALCSLTACSEHQKSIGGSGFIEATKVIVSAETTGQLKSLRFDEGDAVRSGDILGVIDSTTAVLQIRQARARRAAAVTSRRMAEISIAQTTENLKLATKDFDRIASLLPKGSANQQQYDQAKNALEQSRLAKEHAEAALAASHADIRRIDADIALFDKQLHDCSPTAPVSGIIINKFTEAGELLAPGKPIFEIATLDTVWVKVYLGAHDLTKISIGGKANVDPEDGRDHPLEGHVSWISEQAEFTPKNVQTREARADLVYAVKVHIANTGGALKIGMPVMVSFP